jgi:mannitol-specific phosphotransferase system IIBC component
MTFAGGVWSDGRWMLMSGRDMLGILGMGALAVVCCGGIPAVSAFAGGVTVVGLLGGVLLAAVVGCAIVAMIVVHARGRHVWAYRSSRGKGDV